MWTRKYPHLRSSAHINSPQTNLFETKESSGARSESSGWKHHESGHRSKPDVSPRNPNTLASKAENAPLCSVPNVRWHRSLPLAASYNFLVNLSNQARLKSAGEGTFMKEFRVKSALRPPSMQGKTGSLRVQRGVDLETVNLRLWKH